MSSEDTTAPPSSQPPSVHPLVAAVPTLALLVIFAIQIVTAHTTVLTPWKGGGFGMFSTVDVDTERIVVLVLDIDGQESPAVIPEAFDDDLRSLRPMPTTERTKSLAHRLARHRWVHIDDALPVPLLDYAHRSEPAIDGQWVLQRPLHDPDAGIKPDGVRVQVWARAFRADDTGGGTLTRHKIQDVHISLDP